MKSLINIFVRRPVTVIMILAALIIASVFSAFRLPVNRLPEFSIPRVTVETVYPGMAANEIRSMVTIPLEDGLSPVKGLERIRSVSRDNSSLISMDFRWGIDPMAASVLVREAVDAVYPGLPEGVRKPAVTSGDSSGEPHAIIAVSSHNGNQEFARNLAEYEITARLRRIDGVGSVILAGGSVREERLSLDAPRLAALGMEPSDFTALLAQQTADIPAGNAREGNIEIVIVSSGKPESAAALSRMVLPAQNGSFMVEDAGKLYSSEARKESVFVCNGKETAALEIYRRPGADPLRLSREINKTLDEATALFSRDAHIELVMDSAPSLAAGLTGLVISAALGAAAVVCVLIVFIKRINYSLLASISIPVSIAAGVCVLSLTGKSLNSMSLSGLAMGIALVSDVSVIVLDVLHRSFGDRESVPESEEIADRASSIAGSSIASTLTTALVFVPVIMLPGALGNLFGDIAAALTASVFAGWCYAQFLLPSLFKLIFRRKDSKLQIDINRKNILKKVFADGSSFSSSMLNNFIKKIYSFRLEQKYTLLLSTLLRRPRIVFAVAVLLSVTGGLSLLLRPVYFINPDDAQEVWVSIEFPSGTLLEAAEKTGTEISRLLYGLPSVKTVFGRAGAEEEDSARRANAGYKREDLILRCLLNKKASPQKALAEINHTLEHFGGLNEPFSVYFPKDRIETLLGLSSTNSFAIIGNNREELLEHVEIAHNAFNSKSKRVNFTPRGERPELRFYPDREASAYLSIPAAQIARTLYILNEGVVVTTLETDGRPVDVRVTGQKIDSNYSPNADASDISMYANTNIKFKNDPVKIINDPIRQLEQIPLKTAEGKTVYIGSLGRIEQMHAEASLARLDRCDVMYADFNMDAESALIKDFASHNTWFTGADDSVFSKYRNTLIIYAFLVILLLYMAMGAQFESFLLPLILMMSIPFSLAGAGPALLLGGAKIDSGVIFGLTALFGLVVNNSLLLFEISEQKINSGFSPAAAVYKGAKERLRAILITMITTVIALLPLVISPVGNTQKSMAIAMLGGVCASTLLSLFAVPPVLIWYFKDVHHKKSFSLLRVTEEMK